MMIVSGARRAPGATPVSTRTVSSRDLPQPSRSSLILPNTRQRIAKNATGRRATRFAPAGTITMPALLPPYEDQYGWNSDNYTSMDDPGKERGNPPGHPPDG